jgi:hypothetical protein
MSSEWFIYMNESLKRKSNYRRMNIVAQVGSFYSVRFQRQVAKCLQWYGHKTTPAERIR